MKTPNKKTPKPYESVEDFKMRLRVLMGRPAIVSNAYRPSKALLRPASPRPIDSMTEPEREVLKLKGML